MRTTTKTVTELIESNESPLPLRVIPNNMGINLCSVEALTWTRQEDGQLVSLTIHFIPADTVVRSNGAVVGAAGTAEVYRRARALSEFIGLSRIFDGLDSAVQETLKRHNEELWLRFDSLAGANYAALASPAARVAPAPLQDAPASQG